MILLGRNQETQEKCEVEAGDSRRILICGKTGTGKSYTLGVIIEELAMYEDAIIIIVDTQGIFWTMTQMNDDQEEELWSWHLDPKAYRVNILVPGDPVERYGGEDVIKEMETRGAKIQSLLLNPSDISEEMWCDLFDLDINDLMGILLFKSVRNCKKKLQKDFFIEDIIKQVEQDRGSMDQTKEAVIRRLEMAMDWEIFERYRYREIWEILATDCINVLDLSTLDPGRYGLRSLVVAVLARFVFSQRTIAKRREYLGLTSNIPKVWLAVDEAHNFCPSGKSTLAKDILIRWAKEGRQPGLSLVVASQRPSAIDMDILTQCGLKIVHRITSKDDRKAINALAEDYLDRSLDSALNTITQTGEALLIDDGKETIEAIKVRPRLSEHGGGSATK